MASGRAGNGREAGVNKQSRAWEIDAPKTRRNSDTPLFSEPIPPRSEVCSVNISRLSYGNDQLDQFRRTASYADQILRGEKPSKLPLQDLPVKFELVVNLKTAKTLGLEVPLHLQQLADQVIE